MNRMANKYDLFFNSIKDFALSLDLVVEEDNLDEQNICVDEVLKGKVLCESIASFLSNLGSQVKLKNNGLGSHFFDFSSILKCEQRAREKEIIADILNVKIINGWEERTADFENSNLLFLKYDSIGSSYLFVDNDMENPILHHYWEGGDITSDNIVFTSYVRGAVFWELVRSIQDFSNYESLKIKNINWIKFYSWFYLNQKNPRNKLITWRYEFNRFLEKNNTEKDHLLGVDEFEVEFIRYLIENKGLENVKNTFNPYATLVTFKEYLNT